MSDHFTGRPDHPDFWMLSRIVIDQDNRAHGHAGSNSFEDLIATGVDVHSVIYMASQRALRARLLLIAGSVEDRLAALWLDAFMTGIAFERTKRAEQG